MARAEYYRDLLLILMARFIEEEFGEEALDLLIKLKRDKIRKRWREIAESTGRRDPEYLFRLFSKDVHDFEVIRKDREVLEVKVKRCAHAEIFRRFNAADIGCKLICEGDYAVVEGFNPKIKFTRPKLLMKGDDCCHFKFELRR